MNEWTWLAATNKALTNSRFNESDGKFLLKRFKIYQLKFFNWKKKIYLMIQKYLDGEIQKFVSRICRRKNVGGKFGAYKLYFGFKNCLLVKNLSIGIKVSSRNSASETFFQL